MRAGETEIQKQIYKGDVTMSIYERVGGKMRLIRILNGRTQRDTAAALFICPKHYGRIERGRINISLDLLVAFARVHGVDLAYLLQGEERR